MAARVQTVHALLEQVAAQVDARNLRQKHVDVAPVERKVFDLGPFNCSPKGVRSGFDQGSFASHCDRILDFSKLQSHHQPGAVGNAQSNTLLHLCLESLQRRGDPIGPDGNLGCHKQPAGISDEPELSSRFPVCDHNGRPCDYGPGSVLDDSQDRPSVLLGQAWHCSKCHEKL